MGEKRYKGVYSEWNSFFWPEETITIFNGDGQIIFEGWSWYESCNSKIVALAFNQTQELVVRLEGRTPREAEILLTRIDAGEVRI